MKKTTYNPGDIVEFAGVKFVVLDDLGPSDWEEGHDIFILALEPHGECLFGDTNNYAKSDIKEYTENWLYWLTEKMDAAGLNPDLIRSRSIDLTTLDGRGKYGVLDVKAAPLIMAEARRYADIIPNCDLASWLATGWGGQGHGGATLALFVGSNGNWGHGNCSSSYGVRPALVISSLLLDSESEDKLDLSKVSTDELLAEIRRRTC